MQIPSYRDPDCQNTIVDMFKKAKHPERIFVGICWQFVKGEDDICFQIPYPRPKQVRVHNVDARKGKGACWARSLTQKLWRGEEFTLQLDAHHRFEKHWDDILFSMWKKCENPRALLTCYPGGFTPPDKCDRKWVYGLSAREFDPESILIVHGKPAYHHRKAPKRPMRGAFIAAGYLFGPAKIIKDVPYDPKLYFFGEEITLAARLWTHGWDIYYPNRRCIYHDWDREKRKTHFKDSKDFTALNQQSFKRVRHLLGMERCDDPKLTKGLKGKFGFGKKRTFAEYQEYCGVNFAERSYSSRAAKAIFPEYKKADKPAKPAAVETTATVQENAPVRRNRNGRIYVQIASYRDMECQWTVKDLFEKAENPDRISVGICWQFDEVEDRDCFKIITRPDQVRVMPVDWREAEGVCWARNMTQQMWDGEEYTLQIDAHMRFVPGWDRLMIEELKACGSRKPVISCAPARYTPPDKLQATTWPSVQRAYRFTPDGNIRGTGESLNISPPKPLRGAFISAGFMFSRSEMIQEVPYDPYLYFDQEEMSYALRLYTHGWDVFSATKQYIYHYYRSKEDMTNRPLHWKDLRQEDKDSIAGLYARGLARFNHLTGYALSSNENVTQEIDKYGLGTARTMQEFKEYCGVDFLNKTVEDKALNCEFIKDLRKYRHAAIPIKPIEQERWYEAAKKSEADSKPAKKKPPKKKPAAKPSRPQA